MKEDGMIKIQCFPLRCLPALIALTSVWFNCINLKYFALHALWTVFTQDDIHTYFDCA